MPYVQRDGDRVLVDCAERPPGMDRETEIELFRLALQKGDRVTAVNACSLPADCWADIIRFARLYDVYQAAKLVEFTCLKPPRILRIVLSTLDLPFTTRNEPPSAGKASR